jgi:hypothetical protein
MFLNFDIIYFIVFEHFFEFGGCGCGRGGFLDFWGGWFLGLGLGLIDRWGQDLAFWEGGKFSSLDKFSWFLFI